MNTKQQYFQGAFHNARELQHFSYHEITNQAPNILLLVLALILLIALLRSEARTRSLIDHLAHTPSID